MGRFLTHLVLAAVLLVVPALRVLCISSCVSAAGSMAEDTVASDATPACHEPSDNHHPQHESDSAPSPDDCTHGGDASASSLSASVKSVGGDGSTAPAIVKVAAAQPSVVSSATHRDTSSIPSTGQLLGRFLTPLRI